MSWATTGQSPAYTVTDGTYIYCTNTQQSPGTISKIEIATGIADNTWATIPNGVNSGLAIDVVGGFIYAVSSNVLIAKINLALPAGPDTELEWATVQSARGLAIYDGYIYATGVFTGTIQKISLTDPLGSNVSNWATIGAGTYPTGLAIDGTSIYCSYSGKIAKINLAAPAGPNTDLEWVPDTAGLSNPQGLAIDDGYIYCANSDSAKISKILLTDTAEINNNWAVTGAGPLGLVIDNGYIYCSNAYINNIWKISLANPVANSGWATGSVPTGVVTDGTYIYYSNNNGENLQTISRKNIETGVTDIDWVPAGEGLVRPFSLTIYDGFLYCSNENGPDGIGPHISKINLSYTSEVPGTGTDFEWVSGVNARGLEIYNGLLLCGTGSTITSINLASGLVNPEPWATITGIEVFVQDLVINGDYLYCSDYQNNSIVRILLTDPTEVLSNWATSNKATGLAADDTYLYSSNGQYNTITKINLSNPLLRTKASAPNLDNNPNWAITGNGPFGLAIEGDYIYVTNTDANSVWQISLSAPCFNKGTKILCLNKMNEEEYIPIEDLKSGDLVKSYLHGYRKIDSIGSQKMINNPDHFNLSMYKMAKTDTNGLTEDLIVTGGHSILVDDLGEYYAENEIRFKCPIPKIDDKFFLLCSLSKDFTQLTDKDEYTYYHLCLENNGNNDERFGIWANGILTETISKNQFNNFEHILH